MQESSSLLEFLDDFNKVIIDLANIGIKIEDEDQAILILNALPPSYSHFVETMKYSKDSLDLDHVLVALKSKHFDDHKVNDQGLGEGLYVQGGKGKGPKKGKEYKKELECFYCHKKGHFIRECPELEKKRKRGNGEAKQEPQVQGEVAAVVAEDDYASADLLVAETVVPVKGDTWVLDSGCSHHMSPNLDCFLDVKMGDYGSVRLGSPKVCKVRGIGSVRLKLVDGSVHTLKCVRYVPELRCNLVSLGVFDNEGCEVSIKSGVIQVFKNSKVLLHGKKKAGIYVLHGSALKSQGHACDGSRKSDLVAEVESSHGEVQERAVAIEIQQERSSFDGANGHEDLSEIVDEERSVRSSVRTQFEDQNNARVAVQRRRSSSFVKKFARCFGKVKH